MSIYKRLSFIGAICTFFIFSEIQAQSSVSAYSSLGIGDFNNNGLTQNQAMGGLGISFGTGWGLNYMNPALATRNTIFNFQAALNYQRVDLATENEREFVDGGGLSYVGMSLPIKPGKSALGLGINQITTVNYNIIVNGQVANSDLTSLNRIDGSGGVSEAYLAYSLMPVKNLSLGVHGSYLFGSTIRTNNLSLLNEDGEPIGNSSEYFERFTVTDVTYKLGAHYFFKMGEKSNLHLGAIYQAFGNINGREFAKVADFGQASRPDTDGEILSDNIRGSVYVPQNVGFGITYERINRMIVGLEGQFQEFSRYRDFNGNETDLTDSYRIALGSQITPDFGSMDNFLKRITYRFGVEYKQTPYVVAQTNITDIGINFGGTIPMNSLSMMNFAIRLGQRGTTSNGLIRENYAGFSLGFSLNDNTWFYKRVYD
ncbi:hypothetical protein [Mongoliitalea lutea]|uniref:Membrane protein n=1 Tax=Mongoliitalea lutea TaxID=849756 RepID=A0A8J3D1V8_9BACT|nr:hypothetical protein [Mongoliitalea lutea]GHB52267.1 membrane protein [Mongoliitalea lutea]